MTMTSPPLSPVHDPGSSDCGPDWGPDCASHRSPSTRLPSSPSSSTSWPATLLNFGLFQAAWFACVIGAANARPLLGTAAIVAVVVIHLARAPRWTEEARLIAGALGIGAVWDSLLVSMGLLAYPSGMLVPGFAPYWIVAMWALLATTLNVSLSWLKGRPILGAVIGAIAGPLSYWGGVRLGALEFVRPQIAVLTLSAGWAILTPILVVLGQRFDGVRRASPLESASVESAGPPSRAAT